MNNLHRQLTLLMLAVMVGFSTAALANDQPTELMVTESWSSDYLLEDLKRLPNGQQRSNIGYLGNAEAFKAVWAAFKPGKTVPEVDFQRVYGVLP